MSRPVYLVDALRTPIGRYGGALASVRADDLAARVIESLVERVGVEGPVIDDVIFGCANQAGEDNRNVARMAALLAGLPYEVPGVTVNRLCASGLEATLQGARGIACGELEVVLAGGVESMTRAPWSVPRYQAGLARGNRTQWDTSLGWRYPNSKLEARFPLEAMGETAENLVERYDISREDQDRFAYESHQKALKAQAEDRFAAELITVQVRGRKGAVIEVSQDESPRTDSTLEKLATLRPVFREGGSVTAGNSSPLNDGAAALLLASEAAVERYGWNPLARWLGSAAVGVDPQVMGIGPAPATRRLLQRLGLSLEEIDLFELNEAFAAQSLAVMRELGLDPARVNPLGGAIALGHPLGCSGARILTTLVHQMRRTGARRGVAALCVGVGQGVAAAVELV